MRIKVNDGFRLHLTVDGEVWLNTEVADFDGLCVGRGETAAAAIDDATREVVEVVKALKRMKAKVTTKERLKP